METTLRLRLRVTASIILWLSLTTTWAWGPRLEPKKGGFYAFVLKAKDDRHEGEESATIEAYRTKLMTFHGSAYGISPLDFVKDMADELASEAFAEGFGDSVLDGLGCGKDGEDCDECGIPDDWKIVDEERVDVMEFLGIKRAEPLRKIGDWE
jgi:hypothetical protein